MNAVMQRVKRGRSGVIVARKRNRKTQTDQRKRKT
jgi:hypothetical protein